MRERANGPPRPPDIAMILAEIRDLRREAREDRRRAEASAEMDRRQAAADRRRSDARFEAVVLEFRQDSARREVATQKVLEATQSAFRDLRVVGQAIVKTLNRHTVLLERIDRKLGARADGRSGNGRGT